MLLTGRFVRALDDKQRLPVPKPFRESLGHPGNSIFYLAPGTDGSLSFFTESVLAQLAEQLDRSAPNSQDVRAFSRVFFAQAQRVEIDRQGRVRVPAELAQLAGLGREVVLIGVRDHLEIWNRDVWEEYLTRQQARYDEIAENALGRREVVGPESAAKPTEGWLEVGQRPLSPR